MMAMIKVELEKLFCSKRLYLCILGMIVAIQLNAWELMRYDNHPMVANLFVIAFTEGFALISLILCVAGGGISFCMEQKGQCVRYIALRGNPRNYGIGKVVSAFIGGYIIMFLGFFLGELSLGVSTYIKNGSWIGVTSCITEIGFDAVHLLTYSFLGSLLSVVALLVSVVIPDMFITMTIPIVIYYAWLSVTSWFSIPPFLDITVVYWKLIDMSSFSWNEFLWAFGYAFLFTVCVAYGLGCVIIKGMKRRIEHG